MKNAELQRSLQNPHPETVEFADQGLEEWARALPEEDVDSLVDASAGKPIRWLPGEGWLEPGVDAGKDPLRHNAVVMAVDRMLHSTPAFRYR